MCRLLMQSLGIAFMAFVLWQPCQATEFGVGGDGQWADRTDPSYYQAWANGVQFQVGDSIGFVYDSTYFDVRSVPSATALQNCDFSDSTILGSTGNTVVTLNAATTYYFSTNGDGAGVHCFLGMHFQAIVTNATSPRSPPPPAFVIPPPSPKQRTPGVDVPYVVPPDDTRQQQPSSGSGSHLPAVIGGTTGGVVGVGTIASLLYHFRKMCYRERRPFQMHHPSPSPHLQSPAHLHQNPTHAGVGGQDIDQLAAAYVNSGQASMWQTSQVPVQLYQ